MERRKTTPAERKRIDGILKILGEAYPEAKVALEFSNPLEMLVSTILSAQCTDERVNNVTRALFKKYRTARDYADAKIEQLERDIRPTGFYKAKARSIKNACRMIVERFDSQVPKTMEELTSLPGVGRKTANIVLSNSYGVVEGIAVDTHVARVSRRLGLTESSDPEKIEIDLMAALPRELWFPYTYKIIDHGRRVCKARKPLCSQCPLAKLCPSAFRPD